MLNHNVLELLGLIPERAGNGQVVPPFRGTASGTLLMEAGEANVQRFSFVIREH